MVVPQVAAVDAQPPPKAGPLALHDARSGRGLQQSGLWFAMYPLSMTTPKQLLQRGRLRQQLHRQRLLVSAGSRMTGVRPRRLLTHPATLPPSLPRSLPPSLARIRALLAARLLATDLSRPHPPPSDTGAGVVYVWDNEDFTRTRVLEYLEPGMDHPSGAYRVEVCDPNAIDPPLPPRKRQAQGLGFRASSASASSSSGARSGSGRGGGGGGQQQKPGDVRDVPLGDGLHSLYILEDDGGPIAVVDMLKRMNLEQCVQ